VPHSKMPALDHKRLGGKLGRETRGRKSSLGFKERIRKIASSREAILGILCRESRKIGGGGRGGPHTVGRRRTRDRGTSPDSPKKCKGLRGFAQRLKGSGELSPDGPKENHPQDLGLMWVQGGHNYVLR